MKEYKLGDIVTFHYGKSLPEPKRINGPFPVMSSAGITGWHNESLVKGPGVIVGRKGSIGTVFYEKRDFFPIDTCYYLTVNNPNILEQKFLYYLLIGSNLKDLNSDAAVPGLNREIAYSQKFYIPDLTIQKKIVAVINNYDNLIENNNRRIAILEEMAQSVYREWFINFRYPNHQDNLDADGKPKLIDSPLGPIPDGWDVKNIKDLGTVITGKTPSTIKPEYYKRSDVPFLKTPDMHGAIFSVDVEDYLSEEGANSQKNKFIPANSVCVACIGAKAGVVTITSEKLQTNQQINSLILDDLRMREYFYLFAVGLHQKIHALGSSGATMTNVNKSKFEGIEVLIPPQSLLESFHTAISPCFDSILNLQKRNRNLKKQRDMLLPRLISGQIEL